MLTLTTSPTLYSFLFSVDTTLKNRFLKKQNLESWSIASITVVPIPTLLDSSMI